MTDFSVAGDKIDFDRNSLLLEQNFIKRKKR